MDVDTQFPNLSSFVNRKIRLTLNECGARGELKTDSVFWDLYSSCWAVLKDQPRWRGGPHQTLKTLDEFIRLLPVTTPTRRIGDKICVSGGSEYLDTVVEATWALHFWTSGIEVRLEEPFDSSRPKGMNADIVVTLNGLKNWLDAKSIQLSERDFPIVTVDDPYAQMYSAKNVSSEAVFAKLAELAKAKYQKKFIKGVRAGFFQGEQLGILLCVFKSERLISSVFPYLLGNTPVPSPPKNLLDSTRPGLNIVWVHTLMSFPNSDLLHPWVLARWEAK